MAIRTGAAAVRYARTITRWPVGYCLKYVRTCFNVGSKYGSAIVAWNNAKYRHGTSSVPPIGVPVFFKGGRYGHVAISVGNWKCRTTDYPRAGVVSEVDIRTLAKVWNYPYIGWTEDINGVRVYTKPVAPTPKPPPIKALAASTKVGRRGWQVPDLRYVLVKTGYLSKTYLRGDLYDKNVQAAVVKFHKSTAGKPFASAPLAQIGPKGWHALQFRAGRR